MKYWITSLLLWLALFSIRAGMILTQTANELEDNDAIKQNCLIVLGCCGMIVLVVHICWLLSLKNKSNK